MITALCNSSEASEAGVVPTSSTLTSLINCLPEHSGTALQRIRDALVCPAPFWHLDLPYDTLFRLFSPDVLMVFVNAILCEVTAPNPNPNSDPNPNP